MGKSDDRNQSEKHSIFVFYERDSDCGSLYWCEPGRRVKQNKLSLEDLHSVYLRKQTPELKLAQSALPERCFSLLTRKSGKNLNLEASTPQMVTIWMCGLHALAGKQAFADTDDCEKDIHDNSDLFTEEPRRFSIISYDNMDVENYQYQDHADRAIRCMRRGTHFLRYSFNNENIASMEKLFFWYQPDADEDEYGIIFWANVSTLQNALEQYRQQHEQPDDAEINDAANAEDSERLITLLEAKSLLDQIKRMVEVSVESNYKHKELFCLPVRDITDIYNRCWPGERQGQNSLEDLLRLAIVSDVKNKELNLKAKNLTVLNTWASGVSYLLRHYKEPAPIQK